jgi:glutaredoxin
MPNHFYTEPGCAACKEAKKFLISHGIPFEERDIRANPDYLRILTEELDSLATPTLVLGDSTGVNISACLAPLERNMNGRQFEAGGPEEFMAVRSYYL